MWLFYYFSFERNHDVLKSKSRIMHFLNKNINFNKNETESKMENLHTVSEKQTLCLSWFKNRRLKLKLWWDGAWKYKKGQFLCRLFCRKECIVYWIHFQNIHTFTYQKTLLHTLFYLFLKSSKALSVSLRIKNLFKESLIIIFFVLLY